MIANISHYLPITDPTMIFLVVMFLILAAPIVMGKLRIPHIVGMVLAGDAQCGSVVRTCLKKKEGKG